MARRALQTFHVSYPEKGKTALVSVASSKQIHLHALTLMNRSGGAINTGLLIKYNNARWKIGSLIAANTPDYTTDLTTAVQGGSATTILTLTNNDGFLVSSDKPFSYFGYTVSTAESGAPVYTYQYYNGSAYTNLTTIELGGYASTGDKTIAFQSPVDWAVGTTAAVGGPSTQYNLKVIASTAPGTAVQITNGWVARFLKFQEALADNSNLVLTFDNDYPLVLEGGEAPMPYFGTASADNAVDGQYAVQD